MTNIHVKISNPRDLGPQSDSQPENDTNILVTTPSPKELEHYVQY